MQAEGKGEHGPITATRRERATREEDHVLIILGCSTPFLLRAVKAVTDGGKGEGQRCPKLAGDCFVTELIDGETMNDSAAMYHQSLSVCCGLRRSRMLELMHVAIRKTL